MKPSKLFKRLSADTTTIEVTVGDYTFTGKDTSSITITRGSSTAGGGLAPGTCEIVIEKYSGVVADKPISIKLPENLAYKLAVAIGVTTSQIATRFTGRVGAMEVEQTPKWNFKTRILGATYSAQIASTNDKYTINAGNELTAVISTALRPQTIENHIGVFTNAPRVDKTAVDISNQTGSAILDKYAGEIGILLQDRRNGTIEISPIAQRMDKAAAALSADYPITTAQVSPPLVWAQSNENLPTQYSLKITTSNGVISNVLTGQVEAGTRIEELDWTHVQFTSNQWRYVYGKRAQGLPFSYRLTSVKIPLLTLIQRGSDYDRKVLAQLLTLEAGDPVLIGGDFPKAVQGVYFADQITETFTNSSWDMELKLTAYEYIAGKKTPIPPPRIWNQLQAGETWDEQTKQWNDF